MKPACLCIVIVSAPLCLLGPMAAAATSYPGLDLSTPEGEHLRLGPGDSISAQTGTAIRIQGANNRLSGDGVQVYSGVATGTRTTAIGITAGGTLELSNSNIETQGTYDAGGVMVEHTGSAAILRNTGISTTGSSSHALVVQNGASANITGGVIRTDGLYANGLFVDGRGSTITATEVEVNAKGYGVVAERGGTLRLSQGSVHSYKDSLFLGSAYPLTAAQVFLTKVALHSETGYGVNVQVDGSYVSLERVQISSDRPGIWLPTKSEVYLKDSTIETTGSRSVGVDNRRGKVIMEGGGVTTRGDRSHGLYASEGFSGSGGKATIIAKNVWVETFGSGSIGVVSRTGVSDVSLEGATVITHGHTAYGMLANGARLTAVNTIVRTEGDYASGLMMGNSGVQVALDKVDIRTAGKGADGLNIYAKSNEVDHTLMLSNSHIETADGNGITVEGAGVTASLVGATVIAMSREPGGEGAALYVSDADDDPSAVIAARHVELTAQQSTLLGDVVLDGGSVNLHLRDSSLLSGTLLSRNGRMVDQLTIDDSSTWRVRSDSSVNNLQTTGTVSFVTPGSYSSQDFNVLDIAGTLSGGGLFEMRSNVGAGKSDLLRVDTVEGNHRLLVQNSGAEPTSEQGVSVSLIQSEGGSGSFTLANRDQVVDVGTYRYELKANDSIGGRRSDYSLVNTARLLPPVAPDPDPDPELKPDPEPVPPPGVIKPKPEHLSTAASAAINTSASSTAQSIWFAESAVLLRRMGELRQSSSSDGVWMRAFGERQKLDNRGGQGFFSPC